MKKVYFLRAAELLVLAGVVYLAVFMVLNGPAYWQKVKFASAGNDFSQKLDGQYLSLDYLDQLDAKADNNFPGLDISTADTVAEAAGGHGQSAGPGVYSGSSNNQPHSFVDPSVFVPGTVTIPRIGVRAPIIEIGVDTQKAEQKGLSQGVIHVAGTPAAGQEGNAFYAGHSSDYLFKSGRYKTVFALLPELKEGDYFILSDDKHSYYYQINERVITSARDTGVLSRGKKGNKYASLQTSYPIGTALKRFVVVAELKHTITH